MLNLISRHVRKKMKWYKNDKYLAKISDLEGFNDYIATIDDSYFKQYKELSTQKRLEFLTTLDLLGIDVYNKRIIDIGPGFGDLLDICHEQGAKTTAFIEYDPFFFNFNRLKGFTKGYYQNHLRGFKNVESKSFDLIWIKGSICADMFIKMEVNRLYKIAAIINRIIDLNDWLDEIERIADGKCQIVLCPQWFYDQKGNNLQDIHNNYFTDTLLTRGFSIVSVLSDYKEPIYPLTFYKGINKYEYFD